jgi:hypothetical protein
MNRVWKWLERNSTQLQGLAAAIAVLSALAVVPYFWWKWLRPDITIRFSSQETTMPPALERWLRYAARRLAFPLEPKECKTDCYDLIRTLRESRPPGLFLSEHPDSYQPGRVRIEVVNESDRVVPGVRLRLDGAYPTWGTELVANFLSADEIASWQKNLPTDINGPSVVLPELPPLPPRSAASIIVYGRMNFSDVSATVPAATFEIVKTVRVEDKWPVSVALRPRSLIVAVPLLVFAVLLGLAQFERIAWRTARRNIPYDLACKEALAGRKDSALALLHEAVSAGYSNFEHMRIDPDLECLRQSEAFKKFFSSR